MSNPNLEKIKREALLLRAKKDPGWAEQYTRDRWLNLGDTTSIHVENPFWHITREDKENPHVYLLDLMRRPENFGFTCKWLFNKQLAPFQLAILRELWSRPFPMLIGSRGCGKCVNGDTLVMTGDRICRIDELASDTEMEPVVKPGLKVLGENGFSDVAYAWNNGESETKQITTRMGYKLGGTLNHPIRVVRNDKVVWVNLDEVRIGDKVVIDRSTKWFDAQNSLDDDTAYLFGLLVGDGGYTVRGRIGFTTNDSELAAAVSASSMRLWNKPFKKLASKYQYLLCGVDIWDELFSKYGFNSLVCGEKDFPSSVLRSSKTAVAAFIRGLVDTNGCVINGCVQITAKSERIIRTLHFVLTRFGIISQVKSQRNKKYNRDYYYLTISGSNIRIFQSEIGFGLTRKRNLLKQACERRINSNIDIIPKSLVLDKLLTLRNGWANIRCTIPRGYSYQRCLMTPSRLKDYGTTYEHLSLILEETKTLCNIFEWKSLNNIKQQKHYFDEIVSVENTRNVTYDVHVPDGHSFISNGFISHNSFILALYAMLRGLFNQGSKIVIVGAAFRQSKVVFDYCQDLWDNSPVLRDLVGPDKKNGPRRDVDMCRLRMGDSIISALPLGDGSKIRGQRANIIIADEFASISKEIFETVVRGFAAVSLSPVEKLQREARKQALKEIGLWTPQHEAIEDGQLLSNQTILSGTAYYAFNHFFEYWKQYRGIVESRGDARKLADIFGGKTPENFNWKDYCVIRIPWDRLPTGFMDQKQIAQAKATIHVGTFQLEYGACFAADSNGFFKRSLIESCVAGRPTNPIEHPSCGLVRFTATLRGSPTHSYVLSVDPASERDNLSITIVEVWPEHRRVVYCWTTTRSRHKAKLKRGLTGEQDFYRFAVRKIRDLMKAFNIARISIDGQGGGVAIIEALQDSNNLEASEKPIYPVIDPDNPQDTDGLAGEHILEICQFARSDWVSQANHGMRKDFEDKSLLFPEFNSAVAGLALEEDKANGRVKVSDEDMVLEKLYDTLEDCMWEIEQLKDELASIVHTQTGVSMRDRWDTPETKQEGGKKGRLRKDRYSALLMANMSARTMARTAKQPEYHGIGGFAKDIRSRPKGGGHGPMWTGPPWWTEQVNEVYKSVGVVQRGR